MAIQVSCPHCLEVYHLREAMAGQTVRCNTCAATFVASPESEGTLPVAGSPPRVVEHARSAAVAEPSRGSTTPLILLITGTFLLLLCGGAGLLVYGVVSLMTRTAAKVEEDFMQEFRNARKEMMDAQEKTRKEMWEAQEQARKEFEEAQKPRNEALEAQQKAQKELEDAEEAERKERRDKFNKDFQEAREKAKKDFQEAQDRINKARKEIEDRRKQQ